MGKFLFAAIGLLLLPVSSGARAPCPARERAWLEIRVAERNIEYAHAVAYEPLKVVCAAGGCWAEERGFGPTYVYEPDHPRANPAGYVPYPSVNILEETAAVLAASRAFERAACPR